MFNYNNYPNDEYRYKHDLQKDQSESTHYKKNSHQLHTHEYLGSVQVAGPEVSLLHGHRFAGVANEVIPLQNNNHTHKFEIKTDFTKGHFHTISGTVGPAVPVGDGRHVHYTSGQSSYDAAHRHMFRFATLIDDPTGTD